MNLKYLCISNCVDGNGNKTRIKNNRNALFRLPMENQLNVMVLKCRSKAQEPSQNWSKPL